MNVIKCIYVFDQKYGLNINFNYIFIGICVNLCVKKEKNLGYGNY